MLSQTSISDWLRNTCLLWWQFPKDPRGKKNTKNVSSFAPGEIVREGMAAHCFRLSFLREAPTHSTKAHAGSSDAYRTISDLGRISFI